MLSTGWEPEVVHARVYQSTVRLGDYDVNGRATVLSVPVPAGLAEDVIALVLREPVDTHAAKKGTIRAVTFLLAEPARIERQVVEYVVEPVWPDGYEQHVRDHRRIPSDALVTSRSDLLGEVRRIVWWEVES